jgi:hypothetical protein
VPADAIAPPAQPTKSGFLRRHGLKLVASAVITACLLYALQSGGLKVWPSGVSFEGVRFWTIGPYVLTLAAFSYFRASRWRFLLRAKADVPVRRLVTVSWIGFAAILLLPFRIGEFVRPFMLSGQGRAERGKAAYEVSMATATGTVVAERIIDGLYLSLVLAAALLFVPTIQPLPKTVANLHVSVHDVRLYGYAMLGLFLVAFAVIAVFYWARGWAHRATLAVFGRISKPLGEKLAGIAEHLADGLHLLGRGRDAWPFLLETTVYWGCNVLGMWLLAWGCNVVHSDGSSITFGEACTLMGMLGVTILIPGPPGMLGVFQVGIYAGMTMYFPQAVVTGPGAAYVFLLYIIQVCWQLGAGAFCLALDPSARQRFEEAEHAAAA